MSTTDTSLAIVIPASDYWRYPGMRVQKWGEVQQTIDLMARLIASVTARLANA